MLCHPPPLCVNALGANVRVRGGKKKKGATCRNGSMGKRTFRSVQKPLLWFEKHDGKEAKKWGNMGEVVGGGTSPENNHLQMLGEKVEKTKEALMSRNFSYLQSRPATQKGG